MKKAQPTMDQDGQGLWSGPVKTVNPGPVRSGNQGNQRPGNAP